MAASFTVIDEVDAPLLHNNVPAAVVESVELPQLFTTVTLGVTGIVLGADVPDPVPLVHPLTVVVTVYIAASFTVIDAAVALLLHNSVPPAVVESIELPQLFTTVIPGVAGIALGADVPLPTSLLQPSTVVVTE